MAETIREQLRRNTVAIISLIVAITSLSYATWRNEVTEDNRNVRTAGFALIERLASLDEVALFVRFSGSDTPGEAFEMRRKEGWIHVIAMRDLCYTMPDAVRHSAETLYATWESNSDELRTPAAYNEVNAAIEQLRTETLAALKALD